MASSSATAFGTEDAYTWGPALSAAVIFVANVITYALNPNSRLYKHVLRRCGIPRMFFVSNRADYIDRKALPKTYWAFDLLEPAHVVQSYILSTPLLLILHLCTFLYFVATVLVDVVAGYYLSEGHRGAYGGWVTFLTNWSITLLGLAGLVAFIDTARHIGRETHARKRLKAAGQHYGNQQQPPGTQQQQAEQQQQQQVVQRSASSRMGNLEATGVISAWRDYEHASRTNSLINLSNPNSPRANGRPLSGHVTPSVTNTAVTSPTSTLNPGSPPVMLSPSPGRMLNPSPSPANFPVGATPLQQQQQQQEVQLVNRYPHPLLQQAGNLPLTGRPVAAAPAAAAPAGETMGITPFAKQHHLATPAATAAAAAAGDSRDGSSSSTAGTTDDTVVMVQEGGYSRRPAIKGIDEWDWLSGAHCILMEIATTAAFFVSFWYWVGIVGIANSGFALSAGTIMAHAGNVGIALLQIILTRQPIVSVHFQVLLWYSTLYEIFLWIYGEVSGIWRYNLDWQVSKPAGAFALIPAVTFIMFAIWYLAAVLRERAFIPVTTKVVEHHRNKHQRNNGCDHQHVQAGDVA